MHSARKLLSILLYSVVSIAHSAILPSYNSSWWDVGVRGGIPNVTTMFCDITVSIPGTNIVAAADGVTDDKGAWYAAVTLCPSNQYIWLPLDKTSLISTNLVILKSGVVIRGADRHRSRLNFTATNSQNIFGNIYIGANGSYSVQKTWTGGFTIGTTRLTVDTTNSLWTGQYIVLTRSTNHTPGTAFPSTGLMISQTNDGGSGVLNPGYPLGHGTNIFGRMALVTNIGATYVDIFPPLKEDYTSDANHLFTFTDASMIHRSGIESIGIYNSNTNSFRAGWHVWLNHAVNCWVKDVSLTDATSGHINGYKCFWPSIVGNDCRRSLSYTANAGYGIQLSFYSTDFLIENNIIEACLNSTHLVTTGGGVIGYNFSTNNVQNNSDDRMSSDFNVNHGPYVHDVLVEGNEGDAFTSDSVFGPAGNVVVLRNYFRGWGTNNVGGGVYRYANRCVSIDYGSRQFTFLGNVLGVTNADPTITWRTNIYQWVNETPYTAFLTAYTWKLGNINPALNDSSIYDAGVTNTIVRCMNYVCTNGSSYTIHTNEYTSQSITNSLYLTNRPAFFSAFRWPPIGPGVGSNVVYMIPAKARYYGYQQELASPQGTSINQLPIY